MRKNFTLLLLTALFALVACEYNESVVLATTEKQQDEILDGKIPLNRAISNADFVFKNMEDLGRKNRKIKSVDVLTKSKANTRASRSSSQDEENALAYVVNYENNEGFAILAADIKLPPVISIGDEGNFDTEGFVNFIQHNGATRSNEEINPAQEIQYAVVNNSLLLPPVGLDDLQIRGFDTTIMLRCLPLVKTKWGQGSPYNHYSFNSNNEPSATGCVPLTGAQTLASLCYHHNLRPTTQLSEEYPIDWYTISRIIHDGIISFTGNVTDDVLAVASLIRAIGEDIDADYDSIYPNVSGDNANFVNTFQKLGMTNFVFGNETYNTPVTKSDLFNMIVNKNYPVPTQASRSDSNGYGHSFILDGWLRLEYSLIGYKHIETSPGVLQRIQDYIRRNFDLVHVNLGREGECDGYYLPDAFDLSEDKYREYAEDNDRRGGSYAVYNLNVQYLIYDIL